MNTKNNLVAKYNKSEIMSRAWKWFKAQDVRTMEIFSKCLRQSWNLAKNGSRSNEIAEIYKKHYNQLFYFVLPRVGGKTEVAEELANDTFIKAEKHLNNYDVHVSKINTWLHHIAKNLIIDYHRTAHADRYVNMNNYTDDNGKSMFEQSSSKYADDMVNQKEKQAEIAKAFRTLSPKYRKIATMFFLREQSHAEIAEALQIPVGSVKGMINRSRAVLQEQLQNVHA